jgi:hypothetical protein
MKRLSSFMLCVALALWVGQAASTHAQAVTLYDFETGIPNVSNGGGFGFPGTTVAWENSGIGATSGTGALKITAPVDAFSWGAIINVLADPANTAAIAAASAAPSLWQLEFDVTLHESTMPDWTNFVNGTVVLNSQAGAFDQAPEPWLFGGGDTWGTKHAVVPFTALEDANAAPHGGGWLEMGFAINGDWGDVPGSMYLDNIRLVPVIPEPASLAMAGMSGLALLSLRRRK